MKFTYRLQQNFRHKLGLILLLCPLLGHTEEYGDFRYQTDGSTVTITGYPTRINGSVIIPDTINGMPVVSIGDNTFNQRFELKSVTIPNGVTNIGNNAFAYCDHLTNVIVPETLAIIGSNAFWGCGMSNFTIPKNVSQIGIGALTVGSHVTGYPTSIDIDPANPNFTAVDGVLFNKDKTSLVLYPYFRSNTTYSIASNITSIADGAFIATYFLTNIFIPNSVTNIGKAAFDGCKNLKTINLPKGLSNISDLEFSGCYSLSGFTIPNSVANIGNSAFLSCWGLGNLTIPDSVTNIGDSAFYLCSLTNIFFGTNLTTIGSSAFGMSRVTNAFFLGNSPTNVGSQVFPTSTKVYYRNGTTGWTETFSGQPTALWPEILVQSLANNLVLSWQQGTLVETTNLAIGPWVTNSTVKSPFTVDLSGPLRFYRLKLN